MFRDAAASYDSGASFRHFQVRGDEEVIKDVKASRILPSSTFYKHHGNGKNQSLLK